MENKQECSTYLNGHMWLVRAILDWQIQKSSPFLLGPKDLDPWTALHVVHIFSVFVALNKTIKTLNCMKESNQSDKDKYSDILENTDRIYFTDDSLQEIVDDSFVEGELIEQITISL